MIGLGGWDRASLARDVGEGGPVSEVFREAGGDEVAEAMGGGDPAQVGLAAGDAPDDGGQRRRVEGTLAGGGEGQDAAERDRRRRPGSPGGR